MEPAARQLAAGEERGLGGQRRIPEPRYLIVGLVVGAHGVRGELKVQILTEDPRRFGGLERVFIGFEGEESVPWRLERHRLHGGRALLKLEGCDDRAAAETLRGALVEIPMAEALPLGEDEYYEHQIVGLDVWTVSGQFLGKVVEILYTGANEVYVVRSTAPERSEILIPAIEDVIVNVALEAGRLTVDLPIGLSQRP